MVAQDFLLVSVVTGLLVVVAAVGVARLRRREAIPRPSGRGVPALDAEVAGTDDRTDAVGLAIVVVLLLALGAATVVDPLTLLFLLFALVVVGFFSWGIYALARVRGLATAHAVGLSVWLFGAVLIGVVAVRLLLA
ncbi:hypothetical protein DU500_04305 [Haloplanus rubicundus]|uniref:Uncharacterized protein n=1 Tax=Haloplanus rubicundus TaxID=1547898 RepID=A0A345EA36_9EURY|nr:hypothetical protein [Haloplanus rubicundus]AXG05722.1 hypothetical protein DU500_04305 [Haloplanus rubicundus]AXG09058.1 hypothetical protein DU484_03820 [Haloplanus rubicundus]